jgi:hypothetical protein
MISCMRCVVVVVVDVARGVVPRVLHCIVSASISLTGGITNQMCKVPTDGLRRWLGQGLILLDHGIPGGSQLVVSMPPCNFGHEGLHSMFVSSGSREGCFSSFFIFISELIMIGPKDVLVLYCHFILYFLFVSELCPSTGDCCHDYWALVSHDGHDSLASASNGQKQKLCVFAHFPCPCLF